jgi:hypothetical protein
VVAERVEDRTSAAAGAIPAPIALMKLVGECETFEKAFGLSFPQVEAAARRR